jgi:nitrilase
MKKFIGAAAQYAPEFLDTQAGVARAIEIIQQAGKEGVRLLAFPETWLQGYLYWAGAPRTAEFRMLYQRLFEQSIEVPGPEILRLAKAAGEARVNVSIGLHERVGASIYNTTVYLGSDGSFLGRHRKLMPTTNERLVWAMGDGSDLEGYDTDAGRIGGLTCWENHMALARYACAELGVQTHIAAFPGVAFLDDVVDAAVRQLAFENGCAVVLAREVMSQDRLPKDIASIVTSEPQYWAAHGGSAIVAPGGSYVTRPVFEQEGLVLGEIDLGLIPRIKLWYDATGHYARPDVFRMVWDRRPKPAVQRIESAPDVGDLN